MVFPTFLFCVGAAIAIGFPRRWTARAQADAWRKPARPALLPIALGLLPFHRRGIHLRL